MTLMQRWTESEVMYDLACPYMDCGERAIHKKIEITHFPTVLVFNILRFRLGLKIRDHVIFTQNISFRDIPDTVYPDLRYRLISIVVHRGRRLDSGHYVAYFKQGNSWKEADDRMITTVHWNIVKDKEAFLIFYEKVE